MTDKKDKTISFRVNEDSFQALKEIADEQNFSLSAVFRDYVTKFNNHDGRVELVPKHAIDDEHEGLPTEFPPKVEVPKSFVREHEQLELETEHLREQLGEYKQEATKLQQEVAEADSEDVVDLDELDDDSNEYKIG